jgi:hypothetical protein
MLHFLELHMLACPSRKYLHVECPGCGFQRSFMALLRGDFKGSFTYYPATLPILALLVFLLLHIKNRYENGALILRGIYLFCTAVIVAHYIYRIVTHQVIVP